MLAGRGEMIGRAALPWLLLAMMAGIAVWHVTDFSEQPDTEFPRVVRPYFNPLPPSAYRLAEPGDTLDRIGLYFAAAASAIALVALVCRWRGPHSNEPNPRGLWPTTLASSIAASWHASTPSPTFDGWHGLGWRTILNPSAPLSTRVALGLLGSILAVVILVNLLKLWPNRTQYWQRSRELHLRALLIAALILVSLRQVELPGLEPLGYWPRCCFDIGMLAWVFALVRARPLGGLRVGIGRVAVGFVLTWGLVAFAGVALTLYHRPMPRLRAVVPGRIYISAMPTYRGLAIEQERLHFRTIINLFDESSTQASPHHEDELRFVREHGLRYLGSPSDGLESDRFLDETLALARDPESWPILVHCHGCMDRSPAWMGIYRFLVEGKPLDAIFREIEQHRGSRPKAVVTLQYNRKLPSRAPERFSADPTGQLLKQCLAGTRDPFLQPNWNPTATGRQVVTRIDPDPSIRRP